MERNRMRNEIHLPRYRINVGVIRSYHCENSGIIRSGQRMRSLYRAQVGRCEKLRVLAAVDPPSCSRRYLGITRCDRLLYSIRTIPYLGRYSLHCHLKISGARSLLKCAVELPKFEVSFESRCPSSRLQQQQVFWLRLNLGQSLIDVSL